MPLLQRITTPIAALLPDLQHVPVRRQAVAAIVASLVLHLFLFLGYVIFSVITAILFPEDPSVAFKKAAAQLQPLEVEIVMMEEEAEILSPAELKERAVRPLIDSAGLAKTDVPVKDAIFESDQAMKAASEKPALGDAPLPSQDGRALPFLMFAEQDVKLGSPGAKLGLHEFPSVDALPPPPAIQPEPPVAKVEPIPPPEPEPIAPPTEKMEEPQAEKPPPIASEVIEPKSDQIPVADRFVPQARTAVTRLEPPTTPVPVKPKAERVEMAKLTTPAPRKEPPKAKPGFQEGQFKTRVDGGITNKGANAVDADKTPRGVYLKKVTAQIGSRWYYYMKHRSDLYAIGSATVRFTITEDGKVRDVRVVDNTSNTAFSLMCQQCVTEAEITPPPEDVLPMMPNGQLEHDFTFNYVPIQ